ncbi:unnamed protein product [Nippostrongylus brasiliensis]|uniref:Uncharacterized protein n=1 Tax=Nippostrongylus brasiliensis TaxID=27835 RepID=A0A0N4Y854_NIPBR|nr:unnamed protein product [Nippostrongylus brasiliensis]
MDVLEVECTPVEVYRMGELDPTRSRLVKVVLPSSTHWRIALANAHRLRSANFRDIFIRKSMTVEERRKQYELRKEAKERTKGKSEKEWVVYKGELRRVSELRTSGNV